MSCEHLNVKDKLVAWATDSKHGHDQGFKYALCCSDCGHEIQELEQQIQEGRMYSPAECKYLKDIAKTNGHKFYKTNICPQGHDSMKYTANGRCVECCKEYELRKGNK
jgi:hypothetical protein